MHELMGLPDNAFQSLCHFSVGGPLEDARLATRAAYHHFESTGPLASEQPTFNRDNWGGVGQREKEAGGVSVCVHGKGIAGVKQKAEVLADILAAIRELGA